jgi:hypothetical protein
MNQFAVQVREIPLDVKTCAGKEFHARIFLHDYGANGPERLLERFNDPEPFLPLRSPDGGVLLWRKDGFMRVTSPEPLQELGEYRELGASTVQVQVLLATGEAFKGGLFLLLPSMRHRVSDLLNGPDSFLLLEGPSGAVLLNKRCIDAVKPL